MKIAKMFDMLMFSNCITHFVQESSVGLSCQYLQSTFDSSETVLPEERLKLFLLLYKLSLNIK